MEACRVRECSAGLARGGADRLYLLSELLSDYMYKAWA